jgi:4-diphosphocytidyl-2-C-methyl-D-erythritol kinase
MVVECPAKVNTFLAVGLREPNGYHPVRTVMQAVGLFDSMTIEVSDRDGLECSWEGLPAENTVTKALRLLRELADVPPLWITLQKRIPAQAGLGGGSSDAAGLIRAVRAMMPDLVSERFAFEVAAAVGSDVPFFLVGGRARATGYGEKIEALPDVPKEWLLIVKPDASVSTAEAYALLDSHQYEWREFSEGLYNDFERVAPCVCGDIAERLMVHGASGALLCGSGSAVFGVFGSEESALGALVAMANEGFDQSWVAPTLTREESLWMS